MYAHSHSRTPQTILYGHICRIHTCPEGALTLTDSLIAPAILLQLEEDTQQCQYN